MKDIEKFARKIGVKVVGKVPEYGGGAFGAARLAAAVSSMKESDTMPTKTKVLDARIVEMDGCAALYIDGKLAYDSHDIEPRDIARAAAGRPIIVKRGYMEMSEEEFDAGFNFPQDISELDARDEDFQIIWDED